MTAAQTPNRESSANRMPTSAAPSSAPAPAAGSWTTIEPAHGSVYDQPGAARGYARSSYQPTPEQLARDEARRRHLRRNVYAPLAVAILLVVAAFVAVVVLGLFVRTPVARSFIAGLSGLVVILLSIPLIALLSVAPLAYAGWRWNRRQNRRAFPETGPMAYRGRLQTLLWQLDRLLDQAARAAERGGAAVARPLTRLHALAGYWREFVRAARRNFTRR